MAFARLAAVPFGVNEVAIAVTGSRLGAGHIGLGFHSAKSGPQIIHLSWHRELKVDSIDSKLHPGCWAAKAIDIPGPASKQLVALVRAIATKRPTINYGINLLNSFGSFNANGIYKPLKGNNGLTCATFVADILAAGSIRLLKIDTWPRSDENIAWGEDVCSKLLKHGADQAHIEAVRKSNTGLRLRPFEVAGATQLPRANWPVNYEQVQEASRSVAQSLEELCPPTIAAAAAKIVEPLPNVDSSDSEAAKPKRKAGKRD